MTALYYLIVSRTLCKKIDKKITRILHLNILSINIIQMNSLYILFFLIAIISADLTSDRMNAVKIWIYRSNSSDQMNLAYTDAYSNENTTHTVRDTADYGPRIIAYEYDRVVLDLVYFFGFNPTMLKTSYDPSTTKWLDENTIQVDYNIGIKTKYNFTTGGYDIDQQGFRYRDIFVFAPGTTQVILDYTIQDPAAIAVFNDLGNSISIDFVCNFIIIPACNGTAERGWRPDLVDTGFVDGADCVAKLSNLPPNPCPYAQRSNTPECRQLHGFASGLLPSVHCSHVKIGSMVCTDSCLPACANCDPNAECVPTFPTLFAPVYQCQCKNGYVGNGTTCVEKPCNYGNCPALYGSYQCSTGKCMCKDTFTANPTATGNNLCTCEGGQIIYNNSVPVCVPTGRCISQQYECNGQDYNQVKCTTVGYNTYTKFKFCVCNYGFEGGYEYPCSCPTGKRVVWSNTFNGEVCLSPSECTVSWHCAYPQTCQIAPGQQVGQCV